MTIKLSSATYSLIYSFLTKHAHAKAALAVKKAAKDVVELDQPVMEGPTLDEIVGEWKDWKTATAAVPAPAPAPAPAVDASSSSGPFLTVHKHHTCLF
jgi:hypothetical protein